MRITLVAWGLLGSGPGRTTTKLASLWAGAGHDVTLVTQAPVDTDVYPVDERVARTSLRPMRGALGLLPTRLAASREAALLLALRGALRRAAPQVVVSHWTTTNVRTLVATPRGVPVVVRDEQAPHERLGGSWERLRRRTYRRAAAVVVLNPAEGDWMRAYVDPARIRVIPQLVDVPAPLPAAERGPVVLAVGRLVEVKRFDLLVEAFARTRAREQGWRLRIVGRGPERERLAALAHRLGVDLELPGATPDIWQEYARAGVVALTSSYESFPMALVEAMAAGVAVVSVACPTGPPGIVTDGSDGLLVDAEPGAIGAALDRLAADPSLRGRLGERAREVAERCSPERVFATWDELVASVVV